MTTTAPLLPFLTAYRTGRPAPARWTDWDSREKLLNRLGERTCRLLNSELAHAVQPVWLAEHPDNGRPAACIEAVATWSREPTEENRLAMFKGGNAASAAAWAAAAAWASAWAAAAAAWASAMRATGDGPAFWRWSYARYLDCCGPWNAVWTTSDVLALAERAWSRDWSVMPMLADALQDAGCDDAKLLRRLRTASDFTRADRAVRGPLGIV